MFKPLQGLIAGFDRLSEAATRLSAQRIGRRSLLSAIGTGLAGGAILPMLPFDRSGGKALANSVRDDGDETCEYWRYCALDGFLCTCCGGSLASCPPSAEPSAITWIGTCQNPKDNKAYLISYNDCCGQVSCGNCLCNYNQGERPGYRMGVHNDINWCMANARGLYHCTVAAVIGLG